jgi:hypothetical protein
MRADAAAVMVIRRTMRRCGMESRAADGLTLGQARQDDLLGLIKDGTEIKPLDLRP